MADERDARWFAERMPSQDVLEDVLRGDPVSRLMQVARDRAVVVTGNDLVARPGEDAQAVKDALALATKAAKKVAEQGPGAQLTEAEKDALDLFLLLVARPAIFVRNGKVVERPENWPEVKKHELVIPKILAGVGRIESVEREGRGTGFLVGPKRILTNNHVLCALFRVPLRTWRDSPDIFAELCTTHGKTWAQKTKSAAPWFELRGELGSTASNAVRIQRILGHHRRVDMAVLELEAEPADARQLPLLKDEPASFAGRRVYAVGYPMGDPNAVTPAPIFNRIFGSDPESLGKKRFSPGTIIDWTGDDRFGHDASTLAGSSGSAIVDFEQRRVVGLHYSGTYKTRNNAVPLWKFRDDPVLADNGVEFG